MKTKLNLLLLVFCLLVGLSFDINAQSTIKKKTKSKVVQQKYKDNDLVSDYKDRKMGFVTKNGKLVITHQFDLVDGLSSDGRDNCFKNGLCLVSLDGKQGLINMEGKFIVPCIYDQIFYSSSSITEKLIQVISNGKYGFVDKTGKVIVPCIYYLTTRFENGVSLVRLESGGKNAIMDENGTLLTAAIYDAGYSSIFGSYTCIKSGDVNYGITKQGFVPCDGEGNPNGKSVISYKDFNRSPNSEGEFFFKNRNYPLYTRFKFQTTTKVRESLRMAPKDMEFEIVDKTERKYKIRVNKGGGNFTINSETKEYFTELNEGDEIWWLKWHFDNAMYNDFSPSVFVP